METPFVCVFSKMIFTLLYYGWFIVKLSDGSISLKQLLRNTNVNGRAAIRYQVKVPYREGFVTKLTSDFMVF